ncbi:MAG: NAD-dependent epimerase/dehydratase family protein [Bacteroidetes bacterium]|nr:NAD-dependent epimerase/dehydratase family protein [Bacteroidota bacterium]
MQTILGAGGVVANELAKSLTNYTQSIRLVGRNPQKVNQEDTIFKADLLDVSQTQAAVEGSEIAYLTAGLPYSHKVWSRDWPIVMRNVIDACKTHGAKLVFLDNVYMYGPVAGWMTEETPYQPTTKKGKVRTEIAEMLLSEISQENLEALIGRSADFYGPGATNSPILPMVFEKLKQGKSASWLGKAKKLHSLTFTPDIGKALALLGNTPEAYQQVWHLPTDKNVLTGEAFIQEVASQFQVEGKYSEISRFMMQLAGLFNPMARASVEMMYQFEEDYLFDSSKFEKQFFEATPYREGIAAIIGSLEKVGA